MQKIVFTVWNEFSLDWLCVARLTRLKLQLFLSSIVIIIVHNIDHYCVIISLTFAVIKPDTFNTEKIIFH